MNVILEGEGSWVGFHPVPSTPKVLDPKRESGVPLEPQPFICQNFYQTKDAGHPQFKGWSPFWTQNLVLEGPGSHGHSLCKIKNVSNLPRSYLVCFETLYPDP